ncbi:NitT/TauT family transport system substrate-binding protein [Thermocatellispora tengchongensis]|uniref:NitT/TauT family transport system substrate-binding protein n=1 Tax=Thermocatellispora tengchongensis TaxID=1073253 RepID=A0A840P5P7_9ACTN|nr:ABC transporter substrate-binding protein [Thermocatellispora tengchongensis]MBB5136644.1 NitT/TauT family transport system substrate-binding protein [Thermocatellispora tengchongensis]
MSTFSFGTRRLAAVALLTALGAALTACGGGADSATPGAEPVVFTAPDKALTATTASYTSVPLQLGYFSAEKLDVTIQPVDSAPTAIQSVATGQAFMTYASLNAAIAAYQKDPGIAVVGLTNGSIFRVVVPQDSPITTAADLKGATIGSNSLAGVSTLFAKGVLKEAGLDPDKDAQYLPVGLGAQAADALRKKQIAAYAGWDGPNVVIGDLLGTTMRDIPTPLNDMTGTSALVVRKESIKQEPERVAGMVRAFYKAMVFSQTNPEAAIKLHWKQFPQSRPASDVPEETALAQAVRILKLRLDITGGKGTSGRYGVIDDAAVQKTIAAFAEHGMIPAAIDVKSSGLFDYSLAGKYNAFDEKAVEQEARQWKG